MKRPSPKRPWRRLQSHNSPNNPTTTGGPAIAHSSLAKDTNHQLGGCKDKCFPHVGSSCPAGGRKSGILLSAALRGLGVPQGRRQRIVVVGDEGPGASGGGGLGWGQAEPSAPKEHLGSWKTRNNKRPPVSSAIWRSLTVAH